MRRGSCPWQVPAGLTESAGISAVCATIFKPGVITTAVHAPFLSAQSTGILSGRLAPVRLVCPKNTIFQNIGRLEGHDPARQNGHLLASLGVAANALVLAAN